MKFHSKTKADLYERYKVIQIADDMLRSEVIREYGAAAGLTILSEFVDKYYAEQREKEEILRRP